MNSTTSADDLIEMIPADVHNSGTINLNVRSYAGYADAQYNIGVTQLSRSTSFLTLSLLH